MFKILQKQTSESSNLNSANLVLFAGKIQELVQASPETIRDDIKDEL